MTRPDDADDLRTVELEVEVLGAPAQLWDAIATGPGISSWLQPTTVEEREGGTFTFPLPSVAADSDAGPQSGRVTVWEPPQRLRQETSWGTDETGSAVLTTEWTVEQSDGGTCVVRMVTSGFRSGSGWDESDGFAESMATALETLRLYLTSFAGRHGRWMQALGGATHDRDDAWAQLLQALGLEEAAEGDLVTTGGPGFGGTVERLVDGQWRHDLQLSLDAPAAGLATLSAWGTDATVSITASLFDVDEATVEERQADWQIWLDAQLASPG